MISPITFVKEAYIEFKKISWPTKQETIRLTAYVIGVSLAVGLLINGIDFLFQRLLELAL